MKRFWTKHKPRHLVIASGMSLSLLTGCAGAPPLNPLQLFQAQPTQTNVQGATTPPTPYTGDIELSIDPSLLGQQYQHHRKLKIQNDGGFQTQAAFKFAKPLTPKVLCVEDLGNGNYTAHFGYHNENDQSVSVPLGPHNKVLGGHVNPGDNSKDKDLGQPSQFESGEHGTFPQSVFSVDFSHGNVNWVLNGKTATAKANSTACGPQPSPEPSPSSSPSPDPSPSPTASPDPTPTPTATPVDVVFDPADPSSLGDLYPDVPGNQEQAEPQLSSAVFSLNHSTPIKVATGEVYIHLAEPVQENLQDILDTYQGTVIETDHMDPDTRWIQVDMTQVDLSQLQEEVAYLNNRLIDHPELQLQNANFANLEAAKTFALIAQLYMSNKVKYVGFNGIVSTNEFKTYENTVPIPLPTLTPPTLSAQDSWWLNQQSTRVTDAWSYSMGFNPQLQKPVKIAVIDSGFAGLSEVLKTDFKHQTEMLTGWKIDSTGSRKWSNVPNALDSENYLKCLYSPVSFAPFPGIPFPSLVPCDGESDHLTQIANNASHVLLNYPQDHGTRVISTIISQVNNGLGLSGVAPQAQVVPIKVGNGWNISTREIIAAFEKIYNDPALQDVSVVNFSIGSEDWNYSNLSSFLKALPGAHTYFQDESDKFRNAVTQLTYNAQKVVIVNSAGNSAFPYKLNSPYSRNSELLTVGALDFVNGKQVRAAFSNWGDGIDIWAPGVRMASWFIPLNNGQMLFFPNTNKVVLPLEDIRQPVGAVYSWAGTSAAAPLVSGIVALMKAINPNLDTFQIQAKLKASANKLQYKDLYLHDSPTWSLFDTCTITGQIIPNLGTKDLLTDYKCPNISSSDPRSQVSLDAINAYEAVKLVANERGISGMSEYRGTINSSGSLQHDALGSLPIQFGTENNLNGFFAYDPGASGFYPPYFPALSSLMNNTIPVKVDGYYTGGKLYAHRVEAAPTLNNKDWTLELFNVNDVIKIYFNGSTAPKYTVYRNASNPSQKSIFNISSDLTQGLNSIRFVVENTDDTTTPGFSMGIELKADGKIAFRDNRGSTIDRVHTHTFGGNRQSEGFGPRYDNTIYINKDGSLPGNKPYKVEISNTSDISNIKVNIFNTPISLDATSQYSGEAIVDPYLNFGSVNDFDFEVYSAYTSLPFPNNPYHPNYKSYTWGFAVYSMINGSYQKVYFNKDGQRENLDQTTNTFGQSIGSGARFNTPHNVLGELLMKERWSPYVRP